MAAQSTFSPRRLPLARLFLFLHVLFALSLAQYPAWAVQPMLDSIDDTSSSTPGHDPFSVASPAIGDTITSSPSFSSSSSASSTPTSSSVSTSSTSSTSQSSPSQHQSTSTVSKTTSVTGTSTSKTTHRTSHSSSRTTQHDKSHTTHHSSHSTRSTGGSSVRKTTSPLLGTFTGPHKATITSTNARGSHTVEVVKTKGKFTSTTGHVTATLGPELHPTGSGASGSLSDSSKKVIGGVVGGVGGAILLGALAVFFWRRWSKNRRQPADDDGLVDPASYSPQGYMTQESKPSSRGSNQALSDPLERYNRTTATNPSSNF